MCITRSMNTWDRSPKSAAQALDLGKLDLAVFKSFRARRTRDSRLVVSGQLGFGIWKLLTATYEAYRQSPTQCSETWISAPLSANSRGRLWPTACFCCGLSFLPSSLSLLSSFLLHACPKRLFLVLSWPSVQCPPQNLVAVGTCSRLHNALSLHITICRNILSFAEYSYSTWWHGETKQLECCQASRQS